MMLRHLGEQEPADRLEAAVAEVLRQGSQVTYDLKADRQDASAVGTKAMTAAICEQLKRVNVRVR